MSEPAAYRGEERRPATKPASGISKIIELSAESPEGWEAAVQLCVAEAVRTIRNVSSVTVEEFSTVVRDDAVQAFQVRCKVAFAIDDALRAH